jgi:CDP-glucose 4,6-dehydratase
LDQWQSPLEGVVMLEFYKGKTVLVTGHTGFKGSWLCETLINAGAKVVGYSLEPPTNPSLFQLLKLDQRMVSVIGDIRDFDHLNGVIKKYKPEIVFHLAAQPIVLIGYQKPACTYHVNVMGTVNVLEAIRKAGCVKSFLNVTTDKVYENNDLENHPFKEDEKLDGFDPYSNSKSCSELVTHAYKKSFFADGKTAISTARAGNVIGGGDFSPDRIIPDCVRAVEAHKPVEVRNRFSTRPYQLFWNPCSSISRSPRPNTKMAARQDTIMSARILSISSPRVTSFPFSARNGDRASRLKIRHYQTPLMRRRSFPLIIR